MSEQGSGGAGGRRSRARATGLPGLWIILCCALMAVLASWRFVYPPVFAAEEFRLALKAIRPHFTADVAQAFQRDKLATA